MKRSPVVASAAAAVGVAAASFVVRPVSFGDFLFAPSVEVTVEDARMQERMRTLENQLNSYRLQVGSAAASHMPNLPEGWELLTECPFTDTITSGQPITGCSGWSVNASSPGPPKSSSGDTARTEQTDTLLGAIASPNGALLHYYPDSLFGDGPTGVTYTYSTTTPIAAFYAYVELRWDGCSPADFHHNTVSEKIVRFNLVRGGVTGTAEQMLFQLAGAQGEVIQYLNVSPDGNLWPDSAEDRGDVNAEGRVWPTDGVWHRYEFLYIASTGYFAWWRDGQIMGAVSGSASVTAKNGLYSMGIEGTWGGGGGNSRYPECIGTRHAAHGAIYIEPS
ncbi:MAG: hypothetical protein AAF389_14940 [Gemmatimonadota bacterium]